MRAGSPPSAGPGSRGPDHLSDIQILRGFAAVMVVVYHLGNEFADRGFPGWFPDVGAGSAGVDIFFVVSGFIMVHSTATAFGAPGAPGLFLARRLVRLVPLYWLVTTIFAVPLGAAAAPPDVASEHRRWIAASYLFLFYPRADGGDFPLYAQGWTLNFEMFFYACFAAVLPLPRAVGLWALAFGLTALAVLGLAVALPWPVDRWANSDIVEFVMGLGLAVARARGCRVSSRTAVALAALGAAVFVTTIGSVDDWLPYRGFVWGPPACAIVAAAALRSPARPRRRAAPRRRGGTRTARAPNHTDGSASDRCDSVRHLDAAGPTDPDAGSIRWGRTARTALEELGDASYALYLVHYAFFVGLGETIARFTPVASLPPSLYGALCFFGAVALALAVHRWVERPMTARLNLAFDLSRKWHGLIDRPRPRV